MRRIGLGLLATTTLVMIGCQADNTNVERKLDDISKRLTAIEAKLAAGGGAGAAARPAQPSRPEPNPATVYAVPIAGSASIGSPHAKVTIVEAFTFT